jgi:phosphoglycolate phosphatase
MSNTIKGLIFDKDGTLFDFSATWSVWALKVMQTLSNGNAEVVQNLARAARYDLQAQTFLPDSPIIAGTNREAAECLASALPDRSADEIENFLAEEAQAAPLAPAVPLPPLMSEFQRRGIALGVMTNDTEMGAFAHLQAASVLEMFDFIAGFDSGYGAKPDPAPLLAFTDQTGISPDHIAMVGDSLHDLIAGRAAGMMTIGVLTGMATREDLQSHADVVLTNIGEIPAWLDRD